MACRRTSPRANELQTQPALKKGRACVSCRRRKMKCDGGQPVCGSCLRAEKAEDCEYTTGSERSTSQKLEDKVQRLQTRLRDLQAPSNPLQGVTLQQPYATDLADQHQASVFQEPPRHIAQRLLDDFMAHSSQFGFFLHPGRFRHSVQFPGPVGHESRPAPSLLSTMYLLGIHFSQNPEMKRHEKTYFDLALQHVAQDTSTTTTHPKHRLDVIQTEILLTYYFFSNKRPIEARYHSAAAYSLAVASGIHRMNVRNPPESTLPPVADDIEEGERVNAYWVTFCADNEWTGLFNYNTHPLSGAILTNLRPVTPFPREIEEYETGQYRCELRQGHTLDDFLSGRAFSGEPLSSAALHAKAALLFERGSTFSRMSEMELSSRQRNNHCYDSFHHIRSLAMNFKSSLPPLEVWLRNPNLAAVRTAYVGLTLVDAALIRLHGIAALRGDEKARQQQVISAQEIFNNSMRLASTSWNFGFLNPIIACAWREAFNVLVEELSNRNAMQSSWAARHSSGQNEDPLHRQLRKGVASFLIYSSSSPFIRGEVEEMTNILQGGSPSSSL